MHVPKFTRELCQFIYEAFRSSEVAQLNHLNCLLVF